MTLPDALRRSLPDSLDTDLPVVPGRDVPDGPVNLYVAVLSPTPQILAAASVIGYRPEFRDGEPALVLETATDPTVVQHGKAVAAGVVGIDPLGQAALWGTVGPLRLDNDGWVDVGQIIHLNDIVIRWGNR